MQDELMFCHLCFKDRGNLIWVVQVLNFKLNIRVGILIKENLCIYTFVFATILQVTNKVSECHIVTY